MIRRAEFEKIFSERPELAFHVVQTLIARVRALTENVRGLALMDVYGRVARLLIDGAEEVDGRRVVRGLSQQAIAERVGASRAILGGSPSGFWIRAAAVAISIFSAPLRARSRGDLLCAAYGLTNADARVVAGIADG